MLRPTADTVDLLDMVDRRPWLYRLSAGVLGAFMALGLAPVHLPEITVLALAAALRIGARSGSRREAALFGWLLGCGYFVVALNWIVEPFMVDAAHDGWMAPFALILMVGGMALFWGLAFWASWALGPNDGPRRGLAIVVALTAVELLRSVIFTGFPWALIGQVWVGHPFGILASFGGVFGLTFLTGVLAVGVMTLSVWRASHRAILAAAITVLFWAGGTILGESIQAGYDRDPGPPGPLVRVVQPNEPQDVKWDRNMIPIFWQRKLDLTAAETGPTPDVVVWPEVSLPYVLGQGEEGDAAIARADHGRIAIVGAERFAGTDLRNSLAVIEPDGRIGQIYDKHHLVPFGEYFPGGKVAQWLGLNGLATDMLGGFTPGPGPAILDLGKLGKVLPLICYEGIFPWLADPHGLPRADWIVQITNDSWFGSFSGPEQHLDQVRLRAIEQGISVVRSAQTGISAVIDPMGRVVQSLPMHTAGSIDQAIPHARPPTIYARVGDAPLIVILIALFLWLVRNRFRKGH